MHIFSTTMADTHKIMLAVLHYLHEMKYQISLFLDHGVCIPKFWFMRIDEKMDLVYRSWWKSKETDDLSEFFTIIIMERYYLMERENFMVMLLDQNFEMTKYKMAWHGQNIYSRTSLRYLLTCHLVLTFRTLMNII